MEMRLKKKETLFSFAQALSSADLSEKPELLMKNKTVAATLALLMGIFGVHRFYLGQRFIGVVHLIFFFFAFGLTVDEGEPFILAPALVGFIDAVLLFVMPPEEFDDKYNREYLAERRGERRQHQPRSYQVPRYEGRQEARYEQREAPRYAAPRQQQRNRLSYKRLGIELFREYDFEGAVDAFHRALEDDYEDPSTHFNLACSYSMLKEAGPAFDHLEKAIELGFTNLEKIHRHDALAYLRNLAAFDDFVDNGYRRISSLPAAREGLLDQEARSETDELLEQIIKLGELRDKGILTEREFTRQKRKLLGEE